MPIMRKMNLINVHFWTYLVELIRLQGDWSSEAVLLCIAQPLERRISESLAHFKREEQCFTFSLIFFLELSF